MSIRATVVKHQHVSIVKIQQLASFSVCSPTSAAWIHDWTSCGDGFSPFHAEMSNFCSCLFTLLFCVCFTLSLFLRDSTWCRFLKFKKVIGLSPLSVVSGECSLGTSWGRCLAGGCFAAGSSRTLTLSPWKASTCCRAPSRPRSCVPSHWRKVSTLR